MATKAEMESEIRSILNTETSAARLSTKLFSPGGLFRQLYSTPDEKRAVMQSSLFNEANRRVSDLQRAELTKLDFTTSPLAASVTGSGTVPKETQPAAVV